MPNVTTPPTSMTPQEIVQYWITTAEDDWRSVQNLFDKEDYVKALFFGHLYLEKLLKALIVRQIGLHAPYGHALHSLAEKAQLTLTPDQIVFLRRVTDYNIEARYPDWKLEFKKRCTREFCQSELKAIENFGQWLRTMLKP
ncbi:MAG: HEPN domain-containing protein [Chloroflexi bacterium]|nr:HEPN domain-containing protein [Chloroflexota bacterium]